MKSASRKFKPPAWATVGLMIACGLFCTAGFWQLGRAEEKRLMFSEFDASGVTDVLDGVIGDAKAQVNRFRPLRTRGRYDPQRQFLLDNMMYEGKPGYHVLTPLRGGGRALLVNRGWIPADADRSILPDVAVDATEREVSGLIAPLPSPGMRLGNEPVDAADPWPRRQSFPTAEGIRDQLDYPVTGYQLLLDPDREDGFLRDWRPVIMSSEEHLAYAVQWFGFAITLSIIYFVVNFRKVPEENNA
ncbi:MAG: SURF1 family protein [Gammaproteobacteria bacterium]|nr:SURF1 family protein [Gammaproteobacteria bacterium]